MLFFIELRLSELSDTVQTLKHEPAILSRGNEFRQSLDRTCLVQMQNERLLTNDFPETCEVGKILRGHHAAEFSQGSETPVIHFSDRLDQITEGAHKGLDDATTVNGAFQLGTKTIGSGLACRVALDTTVQAGVFGIQAHQRLQQRGAVESKKDLLRQCIPRLSPQLQARLYPAGCQSLDRKQGVGLRGGPPILPDCFGERRDRCHKRVAVGEEAEAEPVGMHLADGIGNCRRDGRADCRADEGLVQTLVHLGQSCDRRKSTIILRIVAAERADVVQGPLFQGKVVAAMHKLRISRCRIGIGNHGLIEPRRQEIDEIHALDQLGVLLGGHLSGDEDAKMANGLVQRVYDRLAVGYDFVFMVVEVEDPVECLRRRCDVVAP